MEVLWLVRIYLSKNRDGKWDKTGNFNTAMEKHRLLEVNKGKSSIAIFNCRGIDNQKYEIFRFLQKWGQDWPALLAYHLTGN